LLERDGADAAERRMAARGAVEVVDIASDFLLDLGGEWVLDLGAELVLERREEAPGHRIVITVPERLVLGTSPCLASTA
jgi:hypothetical protein